MRKIHNEIVSRTLNQRRWINPSRHEMRSRTYNHLRDHQEPHKFSLAQHLDRIAKDRAESIENAAKAFHLRKRRTADTFLFLQEAQVLGLTLPWPENWYDLEPYSGYRVDNLKDFTIIHKLVGKLENDGIAPAGSDAAAAKKQEVWAYLRPVDERWSHLRFRYLKKLPKRRRKDANGKPVGPQCRVKRVRTKASWGNTVVCE